MHLYTLTTDLEGNIGIRFWGGNYNFGAIVFNHRLSLDTMEVRGATWGSWVSLVRSATNSFSFTYTNDCPTDGCKPLDYPFQVRLSSRPSSNGVAAQVVTGTVYALNAGDLSVPDSFITMWRPDATHNFQFSDVAEGYDGASSAEVCENIGASPYVYEDVSSASVSCDVFNVFSAHLARTNFTINMLLYNTIGDAVCGVVQRILGPGCGHGDGDDRLNGAAGGGRVAHFHSFGFVWRRANRAAHAGN
jgi:hypothetical protein